jgi:hypothetical protein
MILKKEFNKNKNNTIKYRIQNTKQNTKQKTSKDFYLKKGKNMCCNKLGKKQFTKLNNLLVSSNYYGLCICCGKLIKHNTDCNYCPNGHLIHNSCKKYLEKNLITHEFCPICGLTIENKKCEINTSNLGGKIIKNKTKKNRKK